jgi:transcriptional regulator with XRE-family HTH domain
MHHRENNINRQIGLRLRHVRHERGLTQQKLGDSLGVSFQQIQKYETGTDGLSAAKLTRMAKILDFSISYFYDVPEDNGRELPYLSTALMRLIQNLRRIERQKPAVFRAIREFCAVVIS